ncbi:endonuclease/exonuclease/phosphatase family protein [Salinibacterium sp. PAMC 21357]|uniref:endonuclease/exonuclease/phosphatase family protein n=1 Tax=Salinibacterium sp. PAMC 21357 TaxID=1112215 RepID=UPI000289DF9E|nr:endonuclease/exonuclease/phosphatase family protein [Salinibacterium sp. PAMC 21357]
MTGSPTPRPKRFSALALALAPEREPKLAFPPRGSALIGPVEAPALQVMSYNIRRRGPELLPRSPDLWRRRRPLIKRLLAAEQPALLGVQEALFTQARFVRQALGEHYRSIGYGREKNTGGEGCPIFYDSRRLQVIEWRQTALSDTPNIPGSTSWGNRTPRIVVEAIFLDLATGIQFQAINTHLDHRSRTSRLRSADALRSIVQATPHPTIMTGDFNTDAATDPYDQLTGNGLLVDTWDTAAERVTQVWGTFPNYGPPKHNRKRIDWVLATPSVTALQAAINVTRYERGWPSDHAPVQAVVRLARTE